MGFDSSASGLQGLHLTADLQHCTSGENALRDANQLAALCREAVKACGLQPVAELFHTFSPAGSGVTGVILLAESHLAAHTWPELHAVTLDVYVCNFSANNSAKAHQLIETLIGNFRPAQVQRHQLLRGALPPSL